mmetsp:Transcript_5908/g.14286  ORF Transcript_5908/g.14286 Transcript_5908/m.14286 type:complete len:379 (+) Transcript_5908:225-1361(+)
MHTKKHIHSYRPIRFVSFSPILLLCKNLEDEIPRSGTESFSGGRDSYTAHVFFVGILQDVRRILGVSKDIVGHNGSLRVPTKQESSTRRAINAGESGIPVRKGVPAAGFCQISKTRNLPVGPEIPHSNGSVLRTTRQSVASRQDSDSVHVTGVSRKRLDRVLGGSNVPEFDGLVGTRTQIRESVSHQSNSREIALVLGKGFDDLSLFDVPQQTGGIGGRREHLGGGVKEFAIGQISLVAHQLGGKLGLFSSHSIDGTGIVQSTGGHKAALGFHADAHDVSTLQTDRLFFGGGHGVPQQQVSVLTRRNDSGSVVAPIQSRDLSKVSLEDSTALGIRTNGCYVSSTGGSRETLVLLASKCLVNGDIELLNLFGSGVRLLR